MEKAYKAILAEIEFQKRTAKLLLESVGGTDTSPSEDFEVVHMYREAMSKVEVLQKVGEDIGMVF